MKFPKNLGFETFKGSLIPQCLETSRKHSEMRDPLNVFPARLHTFILFACRQPINMEITGLDYMNDDPTQVHVLYGKAVIKPYVIFYRAMFPSLYFALSLVSQRVLRNERDRQGSNTQAMKHKNAFIKFGRLLWWIGVGLA